MLPQFVIKFIELLYSEKRCDEEKSIDLVISFLKTSNLSNEKRKIYPDINKTTKKAKILFTLLIDNLVRNK